MKKEGQRLKKHVLNSDLTAGEFAKKLKISRGQLYLLYEKDEIPEQFREKIKALGLDLDVIPETSGQSSPGLENENKLLKLQNEYLERIVALQEEKIEYLTKGKKSDKKG